MGSPARALLMAVTPAVPQVRMNSCRSGPPRALTYPARAALNLSGSGPTRGLSPAGSRTTALSPFLPMTAPSPPRAAWRVGRPSRSETATEAPESPISPAGPQETTQALEPKRPRSLSARA